MGGGLKRAGLPRMSGPGMPVPREVPVMLRRAGFTQAETSRCTTHAIENECLSQLDLPTWPAYLAAVRTVTANWPRITRDWLIVREVPAFRICIPADAAPGTVTEWADTRDSSYDGRYYTVIVARTGKSLTFLHVGRGAAAALAAARAGNRLKDALRAAEDEK